MKSTREGKSQLPEISLTCAEVKTEEYIPGPKGGL